MVDGRNGSVLPIAAFTSCAAASTSRSSANVMLMFVLPVPLFDVISSTPAIAEKAFSSGVATVAAIVSGLAPGRFAPTLIDGYSTAGRSLTGSLRYDTTPKTRMPIMSNVVMTGRLMNSPVRLMRRRPWCPRSRVPCRGPATAAATAASDRRAVCATNANRDVRLKPQHSVDHDSIAFGGSRSRSRQARQPRARPTRHAGARCRHDRRRRRMRPVGRSRPIATEPRARCPRRTECSDVDANWPAHRRPLSFSKVALS